MLDVGQVGTEMLYWTVGSRDLDGGLMCTASHNPKAYTGAKLVRRGALALSGDSGHRRAARHRHGRRARRRRPTGPARSRTEDIERRSSARSALGFIDPDADQADEGRARRRQRDGRPDGRPAPRRLPARAGADLLGAGRQLPRPRAEPAAGGEPPLHHRQGPGDRRRARHRLGRRRRPLLLHRRHRPVRRRRLPDRAARRVDPAQGPGRGDPLRRARLARRAGHRRARRRPRATSTASATPSSRRACARWAPRSAARCPATTTSATSTARTPARSRRC